MNVKDESGWEFEWKNPPPDARKAGDYAKIAAMLRDRPGTWALVRSKTEITGGSVIRSMKTQLGPEFEVTSRMRKDREGRDVYARFIGS